MAAVSRRISHETLTPQRDASDLRSITSPARLSKVLRMRANVVLIVSAMVWLMIGAACSSNSSEEEALLAFSAGGSIYTVRADGSGLTAVVRGDRREASWASAPALAPDGKTLAFVRDLDIWVAGVDARESGRWRTLARSARHREHPTSRSGHRVWPGHPMGNTWRSPSSSVVARGCRRCSTNGDRTRTASLERR
jgi:hypothetical protein